MKWINYHIDLIMRMLKARGVILAFITLLLLPVSCQHVSVDGKKTKASPHEFASKVTFDLDSIKARGTLKALIQNSSTSYFIYKGELMGYEYELLNKLCAHLGVALELVVVSDPQDAFKQLAEGKGDIVALPLAVTKERKDFLGFTNSLYTTKQVLVQRMPEKWYQMKRHELEKDLIRNHIDLIGKEVYAERGSSHIKRLNNLSEEIGGDIVVIEPEAGVDTEDLIELVSKGEIDYAVADQHVASVNATYFRNIDISTPMSFEQRISWAVRKNAPELQKEIDTWHKRVKRSIDYHVIYKKYFNSPKASRTRAKSTLSSISGDRLSVYDQTIKRQADLLDWDWRLLAAQIYQESNFDPKAESWAGAQGLMQLMPHTALQFGVKNPFDPFQSLKGGTHYIKYLDDLWAKTISDKKERIKFVLASYNVGLGHVVDARNLAKKYGDSPILWEGHVEKYVQLKSKPKYYQDPVVKNGYCRGEEPINYVRQILSRYDSYKQLLTRKTEEPA